MKALLKAIAVQLKDLPLNLIILFLGILGAVLTEAETMLLTIFCIVLALLTTWQTGLLVFLGTFTALRFINNWVRALASKSSQPQP